MERQQTLFNCTLRLIPNEEEIQKKEELERQLPARHSRAVSIFENNGVIPV